MTDDEDGDLIGELFYLLTAQLEDLTEIAVDGQAKATPDDAHHRANRIASGAEQVVIVAKAVAALTEAGRVKE